MNDVRALKMSPARQAYWLGIFLLIFLIGLAFLGLYLFSPDWLKFDRVLPVSLRSQLRANYSADAPNQLRLRPVNMAVVGEVIQDQVRPTSQANNASNPLPTLYEILKSPVPTITPLQFTPFAGSPTPQPTQNGQNPTRAAPTGTVNALGSPTASLTGSAQPTASKTPLIIQPINTETSPTSRLPTLTRAAATNTPQPTDVPTKVPPTAVPPTKVPPTAVPPTAVPPTDVPPTAYVPPEKPTTAPTAYP